MTKKFVNLLFMVGLSTFVVSCATNKPASTAFTSKSFNGASVDTSDRTQKVDNFIVILDASGSMAKPYKGEQKFVQAKEIVSRLNQTIPDLKLTGALRTLDGKEVGAPYGLKSYSKSELAQALAAQQGGEGSTPIGMAFENANSALASSQGQTAVFLVSDGVSTDDMSLAAIANLKKKHGDRLCIYPVRIGQDATGQAVMQGAARAGQCGFTIDADSIASGQGMANYVERVFLAEKAMPMAAKIEAKVPMVAKDSDNDGVVDARDQCPRTPTGAEVNAAGCWVLADVRFDTDKWDIKAKHYGVLERAYRVLAQNPNLRFEVQGHTDNVGTASYNDVLSQKRAMSVKQYFVEKGIAASRLTASGYGLTQPIDTNSTSNGRARNRRVQLDRLQ